MAITVVMPRQGNTVESCILVRWLVKTGDSVREDTALCEVETDKASFEVPSGHAGQVLELLCSEGDDVPVLSPIATIGEAGEKSPSQQQGAQKAEPSASAATPRDEHAHISPAQEKTAAPRKEEHAPAAHNNAAERLSGLPSDAAFGVTKAVPLQKRDAEADGEVHASPRARNLARASGIDLEGIKPTGPSGRIIERDVLEQKRTLPEVTAAAKAAAPDRARLEQYGTAIGGRLGLADIAGQGAQAGIARQQQKLQQQPSVPLQTKAQSVPGAGHLAGGEMARSGTPVEFPDTGIIARPLQGVRKIIAQRMLESLSTTAQVTFTMKANASKLLALRNYFKQSTSGEDMKSVTIGDLILFAVSRVLPQFPDANATFENGVHTLYEAVRLAVAVDTPRGLLVPVIHNAQALSLKDLSAEAKRLAAACIQGSIDPGLLSGGTFTVSNLGAFGIESFTPVLNTPQVAILGVNAITNEFSLNSTLEVVFEPFIGLSLTVNHQIIDGAPAARLLAAFAQAVTNINTLV